MENFKHDRVLCLGIRQPAKGLFDKLFLREHFHLRCTVQQANLVCFLTENKVTKQIFHASNSPYREANM
jgi:hypothetical protein